MTHPRHVFELNGPLLHRMARPGARVRSARMRCGDVERFLARQFTPDLRDLVRTAAAVHEADRLAARAPEGSKDLVRDLSWQRAIELTLDVEHPRRWNAAAGTLQDLLGFLTDDDWSITFVQAEEPFQSQRPLEFDAKRPVDEVALFSGGLDSAAGMLARHESRPVRFLGVGVGGSSSKKSLQRHVSEALRAVGVDVEYVHFGLQLDRGTEHVVERTQRSRGFLFISLAAAVARAVGQNTVFTYEAGPGALDLRLNEAQVGAQNTRSMHPHVLGSIEELMAQVLDEHMFVEAPFLWHTKGESCRRAGAGLRQVLLATCSCDRGEARRKAPAFHCGNCTSCLLRRAALHAALGGMDPTEYDPLPAGRSPHAHVAFEDAAWRLHAVHTFDDLVMIDPAILAAESYFMKRGQSREEVRALLTGLMQRHAEEVLSWFNGARVEAER